ncbi:MAG: LamG domain-containing protein [Verrucomicrobiales bacterium]
MKKQVVGSLFSVLCVGSTQAAVVGHWRFEGDTNTAFRTDEINGGVLAQSGAPAQMDLAVSGATSAFPNPVPATGALNEHYAAFSGSNHFAASDRASYAVGSAMTVEYFFNASSVSAGNTLASHWDTAGSNRAWISAIRDGNLRFATSADGSAGIAQSSSLVVSTGVDYYAAAVYDAGSVTFYLQDLTNGGALQSETVTGYHSSLNDAGTSFRIGAYNPGGSDRFTGAIDEVRFSNTALSVSELMIVPEPGVSVLTLAGLVLLGRRRR